MILNSPSERKNTRQHIQQGLGLKELTYDPAMYDQILNNTDTSLPSVSSDMKDVFNNEIAFITDLSMNQNRGNGAAYLLTSDLNYNDSDVDSLIASIYPQPTNLFSILPSTKDRGKPYLCDSEGCKLTTKRNVPVHLHLNNCKPGQQILLTLRYSDLDYSDQPMTCNGCRHSYKGCVSSEDHNEANFCVRSHDGNVDYTKLLVGNSFHPTAKIIVTTTKGHADLHVAFKCWNSCAEHKKYGSDRTLRLTLLDTNEVELCRNEWSLRVCESVKRDHYISTAGMGRADSSPTAQQQLSAVPPHGVAQYTAATKRSADEIQPPLQKRVKMEEEQEPVVHYIDDGSGMSQMVSGKGGISYGMAQSAANTSANVSGAGSSRSYLEAKPLLPIVPQAATPAPDKVAPVVVYPNNEDDKKLLVELARRLGMDIFKVVLGPTI